MTKKTKSARKSVPGPQEGEWKRNALSETVSENQKKEQRKKGVMENKGGRGENERRNTPETLLDRNTTEKISAEEKVQRGGSGG